MMNFGMIMMGVYIEMMNPHLLDLLDIIWNGISMEKIIV
jgi:hypothetical protein